MGLSLVWKDWEMEWGSPWDGKEGRNGSGMDRSDEIQINETKTK